MRKRYSLPLIVLTCLFCGLPNLSAQLTIEGTVRTGNEGVASYAQIIAYRYNTNKIATYAATDSLGRFQIVIDQAGTYTLTTSAIGFRPATRDVLYDGSSLLTVEVAFKIIRQDINLGMVEVSAKQPPLIVKRDTIIYEVANWTEASDQSLEAVLAKMPGFNVAENGSIKVNGKDVDKIVIDGEEITDVGAGLLTRGLTPDQVKSVEVRFDEKNEKLKESLLSQSKFVVLDIKLNDNFDQDLFGRSDLHLGSGPVERPGGTVNLFAVQERVKGHLIAEYDAFGDPSISILDIQNLGREAYAAIFDVPADFSTFLNNPEYEKEFYGFKQFERAENASLGLSGKVKLGERADLFIGSYNYYKDVSGGANGTQRFISANERQFKTTTGFSQRRLGSKNKLELNYDKPGTKLRYNLNGIYEDDQNENTSRYATDRYLNYEGRAISRNVYQNLFLERKVGKDGGGFRLEALHSLTEGDRNNRLDFLDERVAAILFADGNPNPGLLDQYVPQREEKLLGRAYFQQPVLGQMVRLGYRYLGERNRLNRSIIPVDSESVNANDSLTTATSELNYTYHYPFVAIDGGLPFLLASVEIGYGMHDFPVDASTRSERNFLEWKANLVFDLGEDDLAVSASSTASRFPLGYTQPGWEIVGPQILRQLGFLPLEPQSQQVYQLVYTTWVLGIYGIGIDAAAVRGVSYGQPTLRPLGSLLVAELPDQLRSDYWLGSVKIAKVFERLPVSAKLESSYVVNNLENRLIEEEFYTSTSSILQFNLRLATTFKDRPYQLRTGAKFADFRFRDELTEGSRPQRVLNVTANAEYTLFGNLLRCSLGGRYARFADSGASQLFFLDAGVNYLPPSASRIQFYALAENIFDERLFTRQQINPAFFVRDEVAIFGRYLKLGCRFKI